MNVLGIGIDLVEVARLERILERTPRFRDRVFTPGEVAHCEGKGVSRFGSFAGAFAAKEAFVKARGRWFRSGETLHDVEVVHDPAGKPWLRIHGATREAIRALGVRAIHVSIAHERSMATAVVVFLGEGDASPLACLDGR